MHINDLLLLGDTQVALGILSSCVIHQLSYFTRIVFLFFSFLFLLAGLDMKIMQVCGDIMGPRSWESFQGHLVRCQTQLPISFGGIGLLSMEDYAPFDFLGSWVLVVPYLCSRFYIFNRPILEEYGF